MVTWLAELGVDEIRLHHNPLTRDWVALVYVLDDTLAMTGEFRSKPDNALNNVLAKMREGNSETSCGC